MRACMLAAIGVRLGLFSALWRSPARAEVLAARAGVAPRYAEEWAKGATCAGYLTHEPADDRFSLPPEVAAVLVDETSPVYFAPAVESMLVLDEQQILTKLERAFRDGSGIPESAYGPRWQETLDAQARAFADHLLVQEWLPSVPGLEQRLAAGCDVADVGCGGGRVVIRLAQEFPNSRFTGIDISETAVELARERVSAAGVGHRVNFVLADGSDRLPGTYDVVVAFDVLHHAASPVAFLRSMRGARRDGGVCLLQEPNVPETLAELAGTRGTLVYGASLQYCLPAAIAAGGPGLGAVVPDTQIRKLALEAGFDSLEKVASAPLWAFYSLGDRARADRDE